MVMFARCARRVQQNPISEFLFFLFSFVPFEPVFFPVRARPFVWRRACAFFRRNREERVPGETGIVSKMGRVNHRGTMGKIQSARASTGKPKAQKREGKKILSERGKIFF
jgi:hypothetical protein